MGKIFGYVGKFDKELLYKMSRSISCDNSKNLEFVSVKNVNIGLVKDSENDQVFYDEKQRLHICLDARAYAYSLWALIMFSQWYETYIECKWQSYPNK